MVKRVLATLAITGTILVGTTAVTSPAHAELLDIDIGHCDHNQTGLLNICL